MTAIEICFRILAGLTAIGSLSCLIASLVWLAGDIRLEERNRAQPRRTIAISIVAALTTLVLLRNGLDFMLSFIPESWGNVDEYGDWRSVRDGFAVLLAFGGTLGLVSLYGKIEAIRVQSLKERIERAIGALREATPRSPLRTVSWPSSQAEAEELLSNYQEWNARWPRPESAMLFRALLEASLRRGTWRTDE